MSSQTTAVTSNPWIKTTASPWGGKSNENVSVPCSLEDVMSEQLAQELETKETKHVKTPYQFSDPLPDMGACAPLSDAELAAKLAEEEEMAFSATTTQVLDSDAKLAAKLAAEEGGDLSTDELIARCLQRDLDREHNSAINMLEKNYNKTSKVSISFENYKQREPRENEDDDDDYYDEEVLEFPSQTSWGTPTPVMGAKGYARQGKTIVTKHDKTICGRRNAERLMEFPPEFESGDGEGMDMQLPNKVFNHLKARSNLEGKRSHKVHDKKDHSTAIKAVDERTRIMMFKMVNSGFLASIDGVINEGKEAVVFKANGGMKDDKELPKDVILKVYKTTMNEFKNRANYVYGDHRLSKDILKKQNPRKIMSIWAEKEFLNLKRMRRHNMPCPSVLNLRKHVLSMTCIGGAHPAPKLKDVRLSAEHMQDAYEQTVDIMTRMYRECGLVHADFSEYNLLWHEDKVWVIDVSQAMERENPNALAMLVRDCQNVHNFFKAAGVHGVRSAEELFTDVTDYASMDGEGKVFEAQVERYTKEDYAFDFYFELTEAARLKDLNKKEDGGNDGGSCSSSCSSGDEEEVVEGDETERNTHGRSKSNGGKDVTDEAGSSSSSNAKASTVTSSSSSSSHDGGEKSSAWVIDSS